MAELTSTHCILHEDMSIMQCRVDNNYFQTYVVKGVIDRRVSELCTPATQDGNTILSPHGKTHSDLLKVPLSTVSKKLLTLKKVNRLDRLNSTCDTVIEFYIQPIVIKTRRRRRRRRRRKTRAKKVKNISKWGALEQRVLLQGKEFTDDDDDDDDDDDGNDNDGVRRVITNVVFSHEDDV